MNKYRKLTCWWWWNWKIGKERKKDLDWNRTLNWITYNQINLWIVDRQVEHVLYLD